MSETEKKLREALVWCSGSPSFAPEGEARGGWLKLCAPLLDGPEPGEPIVKVDCPCCGAALEIEHGDEPGEIAVIGTEKPE